LANIGKQLTAAELLADTGTQRGSYGDRLTFQKGPVEGQIALITPEGRTIATATATTAIPVLDGLDPLHVPYLNAFIGHTNQRVEKYWRTKQYRLLNPDSEAPSGLQTDSQPVTAADRDSVRTMLIGMARNPASDARWFRQRAQALREESELYSRTAEVLESRALEMSGNHKSDRRDLSDAVAPAAEERPKSGAKS
jgi:hypothetical protein